MQGLFDRYIKRILGARVYDVSQQTRLHQAHGLSRRLGNTVLLKREDEQPVFSFKCRGAFNHIYKLTRESAATGGRISGVIAASAGNHAQGVALAAKALGLQSIIVMPATVPPIKSDAVRALGSEAILHGDDFDAALEHALELSRQRNFPFIHPFDNPDTIAGQASVGIEICQQHPGALHTVFIPIGGGGLAAGVSLYMKYLRPEVNIIGVEPVDAASMHDALAADERVVLPQVGLFADGVAVKQVGKETFNVCRETLDGVILVTVDEMSAAIKDIFNDTRTLTEPAGALAIAGMKKMVAEKNLKNETLVAICSGANINFDRLRHVAERAEIGESREALLGVTIPEQPGSFRKFCESLGRRSITEFNYRYSTEGAAEVFVGVELAGGLPEREELLSSLAEQGYTTVDMTDNEVAKLHIRHMIGGPCRAGAERLFRFRFPERPGALLNFLNSMGSSWNITLFHYRSHGAAYGRVLVGMEIPENEADGLGEFLEDLGYYYQEETENPVYRQFLT
ncbi:MAG: threonine ammonia-lyase, biosynthetic [Granulosicoccus sp.]|nr:threonine ammonia-lyase, biosynthetic [Granulosicoccus sp.]